MNCCSNKKVPRVCKVCKVMDKDENIKLCTYCNICNAYICDRCVNRYDRRFIAALKVHL